MSVFKTSAFLVLLSVFSIGTMSYAQETEPTKILFIGNSYTHMNNMPTIFDKLARSEGRNVLVQKSTHSGFCFREHALREDMYEAINSQQWDYIVLQGYSREFSYRPGHIDTATVPYLKQITDSIYTNNPCTRVLFYMTWGYENGFPEREEINTYNKMADSIERGYTYVSELFRIPVVPVGMIWKDVKENTSIDLYAKDRAHPSMHGSFLIANTFYNALFYSSAPESNINGIDRPSADTIRARSSVLLEQLRPKYHLDAEHFELEIVKTEKKSYLLNYTSYFPMAHSIEWNYGDGTSSTSNDGVHKYKKHGDYLVQLKVVDTCGERFYEERVKFDKFKRRRRRKED